MKAIEDFWQLTTKPNTADTRLDTVPVVVISRATLQRFFRELRDELGPRVDAILYRCGVESGEAFVGTIAEWTGSENPMEIVDGMGDIYSRCGWFSAESIQVDPVSLQARIRLTRTLETYNIEGRWEAPVCHFLRGYFAGLFRSLFWRDDVDCQETSCRGKGDEICEFLVSARGAPDGSPPP